ncbi:MAG: hypothetical protein KDC80_27465 [Saprospiraceae bacterium]|nr:hypothetical protein [Saprospiraceae bacterium]
MYFKKRKTEEPGIELRTQDGQRIPLKVTFLNGEILINEKDMEKGAYELVMNRGDRIESKAFVVA